MAADLPAAAPLGAPPTVIAVGVDGSEESSRAVIWALALSRSLAARLVLVHGTGLLEGAGLQPAVDLAHQLASAFARLGPGGAGAPADPDVQLRRRPGDSVDVLLAVAAEEGADLLVVGRRGAGRTVGTLGSTSQAVVAASTVPVVVLPPVP